jgi:hypothetical protein
MWVLPWTVISEPPSRRPARNRSRPFTYSAVFASPDWIQRNGRSRRAAGSFPNSLPSRLTPTLKRRSPAITWAAVAPPSEWPAIPTWSRSRWPARGELGAIRARRLSLSSAKLVSAARMSIKRWRAGCGGGPITSGCVVCPTTRPPASTRGWRDRRRAPCTSRAGETVPARRTALASACGRR